MSPERPRRVTRRFRQEAEQVGGTDIDQRLEHERIDTVPYHGKGGHRRRSEHHSPSHERHWRRR